MPGLLPHIGQVHGIDPVLHAAGAPHVLPLDAGRGLAFLLLPGLIQRPDPQGPRPAGGLIQAGHREPAHHAHRGESVPGSMVQQPLGPIRRAVPDVPGDRPAVPLRQAAHHRAGIFPGLQPWLHPRERRPHQPQQLAAFSLAQAGTYPDGSSRLRFCCLHKRMIARRLRTVEPGLSRPAAGHDPKCGCRTSEAPPQTAERGG